MDLAASRPQHHEEPQPAAPLPPQRILVVVDPTAHEQQALDKAVRIASRCGSHLQLYVCDVEQQLPESWAGGARFEEYRELRRKRLLDDLDTLAQPLRDRGLAVDIASEWHAPLEQGIGEHALRTQPDLVVKETHRHQHLPHGSLSYTDWNLIRMLPMPLLLVRARPWPAAVRVAGAVDPCRPADRPLTLDAAIVHGAGVLAGLFDTTADIFHVLQMPPHLPGDRVALEDIAAAQVRARDAVGELVQGTGAGVHFIEGAVPDGLERLAAEHLPDVLVIGAVARPRSAHAAAGGTAARVLERVDCDLLVLKPPGFVSPLLVTSE
jgi:universal stress protein E